MFRNRVFHATAVVPALEVFVMAKVEECKGKAAGVMSDVETFLNQPVTDVSELLTRYVSVILTLKSYGDLSDWQACFGAALDSFNKVFVQWRNADFQMMFPMFWWKQVFEVERTFKPSNVRMIVMGADPISNKSAPVRFRATGIAFNLHGLTSGANASLEGMVTQYVAPRPCPPRPLTRHPLASTLPHAFLLNLRLGCHAARVVHARRALTQTHSNVGTA
jgi:hypothetical protein